jgi:hypothetical protein
MGSAMVESVEKGTTRSARPIWLFGVLTTRAVLRAAAVRLDSPGAVLQRVNDVLCPSKMARG